MEISILIIKIPYLVDRELDATLLLNPCVKAGPAFSAICLINKINLQFHLEFWKNNSPVRDGWLRARSIALDVSERERRYK